MDADDSPERKEQEGTKRCNKCGEEKALSEFSKDGQNKDGLKGQCRTCRRAYSAKYRAENKDKGKAYSAKYRAENKEYFAQYYADNREYYAQHNSDWRQANPEKKRANDQRRRARKANAKGTFTADDWKARLAYHGYRCIYCGVEKSETKEGYLTMEHLIPLSRGGTNYPSNLAPSCKSCNCKKHTKTHFEFIEYLNDQKEV